jgi:hypothetical protein
MHPFISSRLAAAMGAGAAVLLIAGGVAVAAPADYRFEAVQPHVKAASDTVVAVRLIHVPDNQPVKGAVIFSSKMEMPMGGMAPMATKISAVKPSNPAEYPFQTDLSMAGSWMLSLAAKVQGEAGTVSGSVPFMAMK